MHRDDLPFALPQISGQDNLRSWAGRRCHSGGQVMLRVLVATMVCLTAARAAADEKFTYDRKLTHVRYDPDTKKELGRKEGVEAKAEGDPTKDMELIWHVRASTFDATPVVGDRFIDDKGTRWA